jgi:hypothetical protein
MHDQWQFETSVALVDQEQECFHVIDRLAQVAARMPGQPRMASGELMPRLAAVRRPPMDFSSKN